MRILIFYPFLWVVHRSLTCLSYFAFGWYSTQGNTYWCKSVRKQKISSYSLTILNSVAAGEKKWLLWQFHKKRDRLSSTFPYCTGHFSWCTGRFHTMYKSGKKSFKYVCGKSMGRGNNARLWPLVLMFSEIYTDSSWELSGKPQLNLFLLITYRVCMICLLCVLGLETLVS